MPASPDVTWTTVKETDKEKYVLRTDDKPTVTQ